MDTEDSAGQLVSFSPDDGAQIEAVDVGKPMFIPPVIAGGIIYAVTDNGELVVLR